jgi:hypothetical protein
VEPLFLALAAAMPAEGTPLMASASTTSELRRATARAGERGIVAGRTVSAMRAAWYVEDGQLGLPPRDHLDGEAAPFWVRDAYVTARVFSSWIYAPTLLMLYVLCLMEMPLWCGPAAEPKWEFVNPNTACPAPADPTSQIYLSGIPYLPPGLGVVLELLCYVLLLAAMGLDVRWRGLAHFTGEVSEMTTAVLAAVAVVDTLVYACVWQANFRLAPYCRLAVIANTEPLRTSFIATAVATPPSFRIMGILVFSYALGAATNHLLWGGASPALMTLPTTCCGEEHHQP